MNHDRLLTRVYDKQEKKMLYSTHFDPLSKHIYEDNYIGLNEYGVIFASSLQPMTFEGGMDLEFIPFGDRFVPMMCYGEQDKNKKLIYDGDMVTGCYDDYELAEAMGMDDFKITNGLVKFEHGCFSLYEIDCSDINDHEDFSCYMNMTKDLEITGNKWEQPELWELKT